MAVLSRVATGVRTVTATSAQLTTITVGETISAGQQYRISTADNKAYLPDANVIDPTGAEFDGYALGSASADQKVAAQTGGTIYLGVAAVEGMFYCVSATPGETEEATSALASGNIGTIVGYGDEDGNVVIDPIESAGLIPT